MKTSLTAEFVLGILDRLVAKEINWPSIKYISALAILKGRKKSTIKAFLKSVPARLKKTVEAVCVDMYDGYINAVKEVFKNSALIVVDRFHVAKLCRGKLDKYHQKILRELKQELSDAGYKKTTGATRILHKNNECLTREEKEALTKFEDFLINLSKP